MSQHPSLKPPGGGVVVKRNVLKRFEESHDFGDIVELTAETTEGSGGYKWTWGGCAQPISHSAQATQNSSPATRGPTMRRATR